MGCIIWSRVMLAKVVGSGELVRGGPGPKVSNSNGLRPLTLMVLKTGTDRPVQPGTRH